MRAMIDTMLTLTNATLFFPRVSPDRLHELVPVCDLSQRASRETAESERMRYRVPGVHICEAGRSGMVKVIKPLTYTSHL